jgi:hypothetical protein
VEAHSELEAATVAANRGVWALANAHRAVTLFHVEVVGRSAADEETVCVLPRQAHGQNHRMLDDGLERSNGPVLGREPGGRQDRGVEVALTEELQRAPQSD